MTEEASVLREKKGLRSMSEKQAVLVQLVKLQTETNKLSLQIDALLPKKTELSEKIKEKKEVLGRVMSLDCRLAVFIRTA